MSVQCYATTVSYEASNKFRFIINNYMLSDVFANDERIWSNLRWIFIGQIYESKVVTLRMYQYSAIKKAAFLLPVIEKLRSEGKMRDGVPLFDRRTYELTMEQVLELFPECFSDSANPIPDYALTDYIREKAGFI